MKTVHADALHLVGGMIIWAVWFIAMYGGTAVGCKLAPPSQPEGAYTWINISLVIFTAITVYVLLFCFLRCLRIAGDSTNLAKFMRLTGASLYLVAALATVAIGAPVIIVAPCI